jgi:hypothetical protein
MKDAIVEKLRAFLSGSVETECQVVYLLCEVRKLLCHPSPFALRLHCNWALHINLSFAISTSDFLTRVDDYAWNILSSPERGEEEQISWEKRAQEMLLEFMNLNTLRNELLNFLVAYDLPPPCVRKMSSGTSS